MGDYALLAAVPPEIGAHSPRMITIARRLALPDSTDLGMLLTACCAMGSLGLDQRLGASVRLLARVGGAVERDRLR